MKFPVLYKNLPKNMLERKRLMSSLKSCVFFRNKGNVQAGYISGFCLQKN